MFKATETVHWRRIRRRTVLLALVWLALAVAVPWWAPWLDRWSFLGMPLGYWCSSTGLLLGFAVLTFMDIRLMESVEGDARAAALPARREEA